MKPIKVFAVMTVTLCLNSCGSISDQANTTNPVGVWDATISYQRENGEQISQKRYFAVDSVKEDGDFVSDGLYHLDNTRVADAYVDGNFKTGDVNLRNALTYPANGEHDDVVCHGRFISNAYYGHCVIGSGIDFGWKKFELDIYKRR